MRTEGGQLIAEVILWADGMVTCFGSAGTQLPEYQGRYEDVRGRIMAEAPPDAAFCHGVWGGPVTEVERGEW